MDSVSLLHHILERAAGTWPEREAVVHREERRIYRTIEEHANRVAHALDKAGIEAGDRVGILIPNSVEYICSYFGVSKMGGCAVPINTATDSSALQYILEDAGIRCLIFGKGVRAASPSVLQNIDHLGALFTAGESPFSGKQVGRFVLRSLDEIFQVEPCGRMGREMPAETLACLLYTSGSTGTPKGVMLTHQNIVENTKSILGYLDLQPEDKTCVVLPFYYCYGASLLHTHFSVGGTLLLENQFVYPNRVLERMCLEKVTGFAGVPSTFSILLRRSNIRNHSFDHLRYVTQAGGAMAPALVRELREVLPETKIFIMYGQTEATARLSYLPPESLDDRLGSIGKGIPGVALTVINDKGEAVRPGEVGEIVAAGPNIMRGYWNNPEETRRVLDDKGFLHTGDLARVDEDGFIYVVGRKKDMIKSGAHRVSAKEIEDILLEESSILECAVIGVEDEMMGEAIKAYIVPVERNRTDEDLIRRFCKKRLPSYKVPKHIEFRKGLPKNEAGKIMKGVMKEELRLARKVA